MSDLEDRLKSWFAAEVSRAERDLASSKVRTARVRRRRPIPGLALAGLFVALVVVALAVRPTVAPDSGKGPHRSPTSSPIASGGVVAFGPDGLPAILEGEPVLRVEDARGPLLANGRPVLVAGWYAASYQRCAAFIGRVHPLLQSCGNGWLVPTKDDKAGVGLELEESPADIQSGPVVLRLHTHDPRAATCEPSQRARCEAAIVADEVAWPPAYWNGIPRKVAGESVRLIADAYDLLTNSGEPQRLLVGGWFSNDPIPCPSQPGAPVSPLVPRCNGAQLSETREPGGVTIAVIPNHSDIPRGRVVLRVHTGDPQAASCPKAVQDICERAIVVDEVVWSEPLAPIAARFPDGIPLDVDGERVFRVADMSGAPESSFLLGGWAPGPPWGCGLVEVVLPPGVEVPMELCSPAGGLIADGPSSRGIWTSGSFETGPVVVRVQRSPDCSGRLGCALRPEFVVEQVLWTGDQLTNTAPLTIEEIATALYTHRDAVGAGDDIGVEAVAIDRTCRSDLPAVVWRATRTTRIGSILVYPTVAAREEAQRQPPFVACNGADALVYLAPSAAVDNVIVYTKLDSSRSDADQRALADAIVGWLREIPH